MAQQDTRRAIRKEGSMGAKDGIDNGRMLGKLS